MRPDIPEHLDTQALLELLACLELVVKKVQQETKAHLEFKVQMGLQEYKVRRDRLDQLGRLVLRVQPEYKVCKILRNVSSNKYLEKIITNKNMMKFNSFHKKMHI